MTEKSQKKKRMKTKRETKKEKERLPYCDISNPYKKKRATEKKEESEKEKYEGCLIVTSATPATSAISRWDFLSTLA